MSHKKVKKKLKDRSYTFAVSVALIVTLLFIVVVLIYSGLVESIAIKHVALLGIGLFFICFTAVQIGMQQYIYRRISAISGNMSDEEDSVFINGPVVTDMQTLTDQVGKFAENKKFEIETLQVREEYRKEFIGNISHELKTPLFNVQGYIDTLIDGAHKEKAIRKKYLNRAQKGVERLIYIVNDLDMITKLEIGDMSLDKSNFDIVNLVRQVFEQFEMKASKKNITLTTDIDYLNPILVNADMGRIHQVLGNLIANSIKYGKSNGTTEISIEDLINNKVIVRVTDNGEGIAAEFIPRLFERFFRIDRTGNRKEGGSGLGLSIVKHIIEAHNEHIYVESESGIGSEFSFTLEKVLSSNRSIENIEVITELDAYL